MEDNQTNKLPKDTLEKPYNEPLLKDSFFDSDEFSNYREGDSDYDDNLRLLQRARWVLESYFGEKPTPEQVIAFSNSIAIKDLHSLLTMEGDGDCPLYIEEQEESFINPKGQKRYHIKKVGLATILSRLTKP